MTFLVAFARPDFALVAADRRGYQLEDGSDTTRPRGIIDGVRKVYPLPGGWLVGSFHAASLDRIAAALASCALTDLACVRRRLVAVRPTFERWLAGLPPRRGAQARDAAHVWTIAPASTGFVCRDFNWITGDEDLVAPGQVGACVPVGMAEGDLLTLLQPYHTTIETVDRWDALRRTAALFRAVADHLGPTGSVSADVEIGVLWRDSAGRVVRAHVPPTAAARLEAATAQELEGLLLALETHRRVPRRLPQTAELYALNTKTIKVGTVASPSSITRTIRVTHAEFTADTEAGFWEYRDGYLKPHTTSGTQFYHAPLHIPPGVTITQIAARFFRNAVGDFAFAQILSTGDVGTGSSLASVTHDTTSWQTKTASLSEVVSATTNYVLSASLGATSADTDARLAWVEITYTRPDYAATY
jgi:hypothetical protein